MGLYNGLQYPLFSGIYSYTPTNPMNQGLSFPVPMFPNQLSYQWFLPAQPNYSGYQAIYNNIGTGMRASVVPGRTVERTSAPVHVPPSPKF